MQLYLDDAEAAELAQVLSGHEDPRIRALAVRFSAPLLLALAVEAARQEGFKISVDGTGAARIALDRLGSPLSEAQAYRLWRSHFPRTK